MIRHIVYTVAPCFVLGVLWRSFYSVSEYELVFALFLSAAIWAAFFIARVPQQLRRLAASLVLGIAVLSFGVLYMNHAFIQNTHKFLPPILLSEEHTYRGVVVEEPDFRETSTRLTVRLQGIEGQEIASDRQPKVVLVTDLYSPYVYGDEISFVGTLEQPENFQSDTGRIFDYVHYLGKDGIFYQMYQPTILLVSQGHGVFILGQLHNIKRLFVSNMKKFLPEPQVSLASGLLVGAKQALGQKILDAFRRVGLVHVVVLSGYHVSVITDVLMKMLAFLPLIARSFFGVIGIILFVLFVGGGATVVRAGLMASLIIVAKVFGRTADSLYLLVVVGLSMVIHNPYIVAFDISFQLSFLATLGLIVLSPVVERYFTWLSQKFGIREIVVATIATQIFVLPILIYNVGIVSVLSLFANVLVLVTVPWAMFFSFLTGLLGFLPTVFVWPVASLAYILLSYELWVVELFARIPFVSFVVPYVPFFAVVLVYVVYAVIAGFLFVRLHKNSTVR